MLLILLKSFPLLLNLYFLSESLEMSILVRFVVSFDPTQLPMDSSLVEWLW